MTCVSGTSKTGTKHLYYKCVKCNSIIFNETDFEKQFITCMRDLLAYLIQDNRKFIMLSNKDYCNEIDIIENNISNINNQEENAKIMILNKQIKSDELKNILNKLSQKKAYLLNRLSDLSIRNKKIISINNDNFYGNNCLHDQFYSWSNNSWFKLSNKEKVKIINTYIERIDFQMLYKGHIKINKIIIKEEIINNICQFR